MNLLLSLLPVLLVLPFLASTTHAKDLVSNEILAAATKELPSSSPVIATSSLVLSSQSHGTPGNINGHMHAESSATLNGQLIHHRAIDKELTPGSESSVSAADLLAQLDRSFGVEPFVDLQNTISLDAILKRLFDIIRTMTPEQNDTICEYFDAIGNTAVNNHSQISRVIQDVSSVFNFPPMFRTKLLELSSHLRLPMSETYFWKELHVCRSLHELREMSPEAFSERKDFIMREILELLPRGSDTIPQSEGIKRIHGATETGQEQGMGRGEIRTLPTVIISTTLEPTVHALIAKHRDRSMRSSARDASSRHTSMQMGRFVETPQANWKRSSLNMGEGMVQEKIQIPNVQMVPIKPPQDAHQMTLVYILTGSILLVGLLLLTCFLKANVVKTKRGPSNVVEKGNALSLNDVVKTPSTTLGV